MIDIVLISENKLKLNLRDKEDNFNWFEKLSKFYTKQETLRYMAKSITSIRRFETQTFCITRQEFKPTGYHVKW